MAVNYLPSKKFLFKVAAIIIGVVVVVLVSILIKNYQTGKDIETAKKIEVKELVQKDSNANGIPDWEENLWGLDPTKNGPENKEYILARRRALSNADPSATDAEVLASGAPVNNNETLSREFFAVLMSLEQSGNLDDASLGAISDSIGEQITATPLPDSYTKDMVTIARGSDSASSVKYYKSLKAIYDKYQNKNMGNELNFLATALRDNDTGALKQMSLVAGVYRSLGSDLMKVEVPIDFVSSNLHLANDYDKMAKTIDDLGKVFDDPIIAMKAIVNYKNYSDALVVDMGQLSDKIK